MRNSMLAAFAAPIFAFAMPAAAETVTIKVDHGDLDLSRPEQVEILKNRIDSAVKFACRVRSPLYSGWTHVDETCVSQATSAALAVAERRIPAQVASAE